MRSVNSARVELQDAKNSATRAKIHQLAKLAFRDALEGFDKRRKHQHFIITRTSGRSAPLVLVLLPRSV